MLGAPVDKALGVSELSQPVIADPDACDALQMGVESGDTPGGEDVADYGKHPTSRNVTFGQRTEFPDTSGRTLISVVTRLALICPAQDIAEAATGTGGKKLPKPLRCNILAMGPASGLFTAA
jgi:hypothetical protein